MPIYSLSVASVAAAAAAPYQEYFTDATGRCYVLEIGFFTNAATSSSVGFGRPAAIGVTPTSPVAVLAEDAAFPAAGTRLQTASAWGTAPTAPANFFRRITTAAVIGAGVIYTFPKGLVIPVSASVVLWNFGGAAGSVLQNHLVADL